MNQLQASEATEYPRFCPDICEAPPVPPINKAGIQEHLLAIVATCDLVCLYFILLSDRSDLWNTLQPFRFVKRPAVHGFITYLNHKINNNNIPRKSCIATSVNAKVAKLDEVTLDIIDVHVYNVVTLPC